MSTMTSEMTTPHDATITWNDRLDYFLPRSILFLLGVFLLINTITIWSSQPLLAPGEYPLNSSKPANINIYEDDGILTLFVALGHREGYRDYISYGIDVGGPYLIFSRVAAGLARSMGLVVLNDNTSLYLNQTAELDRLWKILCQSKLLLMLLLPLSLYWLTANHFHPRAGLICVALFVAMPFVPGFELRLKPDSLALACGLMSILHQLQYLKRRSTRHLYAACAWLGVSFSIKLLLFPAAATLAAAHGLCLFGVGGKRVERPLRATLLAGIILVGCYLAANPYALPGLVVYVTKLISLLGATSATSSGDTIPALVRRWSTLDIFLGPLLPLFIAPSLVMALYLSLRGGSQRLFPAAFLLLVSLQTIYFTAAFKGQLLYASYYYYSHAVLLLPLLGIFFHEGLGMRGAWSLPVRFLFVLALLACLIMAIDRQAQVYAYLASPNDRQAAHGWITRTLPAGTSIGIPIPVGGGVTNSFIRLDPFRYKLAPVGRNGSLTPEYAPEYVLWVRPDASSPGLEQPGYSLAARFNHGTDLPHDLVPFFQEEIYELYARDNEKVPAKSSPWEMEYVAGEWMREDAEESFNILQFQALNFFPISMDLFRKSQDTLLPLPTSAYAGSLRHASSPLSYVHQADPAALVLWGVKYLLADLRPQSVFLTDPQSQEGFRFRFMGDAQATVQDAPRNVGLFRNEDYLGQAVFIPDPAPGTVVEIQQPRGRFLKRPFPLSGVAYPQTLAAGNASGRLEVVITLDTMSPLDIILKSGQTRRSYLVGPGYHELVLPFTVGEIAGDVSYEINPAGPSPIEGLSIKSFSVSPMPLQAGRIIRRTDVNSDLAFVQMDSHVSGRVILPLPYAAGWKTDVDGKPGRVTRGPAGTVAVHTEPGQHFVSFRSRS